MPTSKDKPASKPAAEKKTTPDAAAALSKQLTALENRVEAIELALGSALGISV